MGLPWFSQGSKCAGNFNPQPKVSETSQLLFPESTKPLAQKLFRDCGTGSTQTESKLGRSARPLTPI